MADFSDNFWDVDFTSTVGFDVLIKRTKDGREMCKDYEEFIKQRSRAEKTYGDSLIRASRNAGGRDEIGGLKVSWDELIKQTENIGLKHINLSNQLLDESRKIEEYREKQKESLKKPTDSVKSAQNNKKDWFNKVMQSKRTYESKCKEKDAADEAQNKGKMVTVQIKEVEKLQQKCERAKLAFESAEHAYKSNVKTLEDLRQHWAEQMVQFCATVQHMEEERIRFLRGNMWTFTNINTLQCVHDDEVYDNVRKVLENLDEKQDVVLFASQKGTSRKRPLPIAFEPYYKDQHKISPHSSLVNANGGHQGAQARRLPTVPGKPGREDETYAVVQ